ncbi:MAG: hypothetical protein K2W82_06525 [Candidatus Obscuribacterales bacterium]|nr:hypothetical protein [Candidatus Obscuribacterales bacterium]
MDFSWVKQLAEQTNQFEISKQEEERRRLEERRLAALATVPFTEKLHVFFRACCEEFNNYCMFPDSRINLGRLEKKGKGQKYSDDLHEEPMEIAYFTFCRKSWLYGIRGINGIVEFVQLPVTEGAGALAFKLDELGLDSRYKLEAKIDSSGNKNVLWRLNEEVMDGSKIEALCQHYFSDFIKATNE